MPFVLPPLPYARNALEPVMSEKTFSFHYDKHHQAYVTNLNNLVKDTPLASASLEDVIRASAKDSAKQGIFKPVEGRAKALALSKRQLVDPVER